FRRLSTPGRYPAPCPAELGLSSTPVDAAILTRLPNCQPMPRRGLEPPRRFRHQILSLACLPVSAPGQPPHSPSPYLNSHFSAPERTRTSTGLRPLDPESSASTSSATGASHPHLLSAPGEIRTPGLLIRSQTLYPAELRAHHFHLSSSTPPRRRQSLPPGSTPSASP